MVGKKSLKYPPIFNVCTASFVLVCSYMFVLVSGFNHDVHANEEIVKRVRHFEIVIPEVYNRLLRSRRSLAALTITSEGHIPSVTFSLQAFGKLFTLDVVQNRGLFVADFVERYHRENGTEEIHIKDHDHCFYHGVVRGYNDSSVALSTCNGIDGLFFDGEESYYIEPLKVHSSKVKEKHIVYKMKDVIVDKPHVCSLHGESHSTADHLNYLMHSHVHYRGRRSIYSETKYVEMVIVNDFKQYSHFKDKTSTVLRAKQIANLVDSIYRPLNVRIALIMVETWTEFDLITVDKDSSVCLDNFLNYKEKTLSKKYRNDNAQLLSRQDFDGATVGKAQVNVICTMRSGGVTQDHSSNAAVTAATLAHELGHNFNMAHDELVKPCSCNAPKERGCLMESVGRSEPARDFSSCSIDSLKKTIARGRAACLFNLPKQLYGDPICGNAFKEEGEECDCGTQQECIRDGITCCNSTTCKLLPHAQCSDGVCCEDCKFKKQGTSCRESVGGCDLPEVCTGISEICPPNVHIFNGYPCHHGKAYCYEGECVNHDIQCQQLWGPGAYKADDKCYEVLNPKGNEYGHCYSATNKYIPCKKEDVLCGKLQCQGSKSSYPVIGTQRKSTTFPVNGVSCVSGSAYLGEDIPDPGLTMEGTKCADGKICLDGKCKPLYLVTSPSRSCPFNCSGHGVCNSQGNCHCDPGWKCPWCKTRGFGGSIDSGHDCHKDGDTAAQVDSVNIAAAVLLPMFFIALLVVVFFVYIYRRHIGEKISSFWAKQHDQESVERTVPKPTISRPVRPRSNPYLTVPVQVQDGTSVKPVRPAPRCPLPGTENRPVLKPVSNINKHPLMRNESSSSTASTSSLQPLLKHINRSSSGVTATDKKQPPRPPRPVGRSASSACALDHDRQPGKFKPVSRSASTASHTEKPKRPPPPPPGSRASTGLSGKPSVPQRPPSLLDPHSKQAKSVSPLAKPTIPPVKTVFPLTKTTPRPWETTISHGTNKPSSSLLENTQNRDSSPSHSPATRTASIEATPNVKPSDCKQRFSTGTVINAKALPTPRKQPTGTTNSHQHDTSGHNIKPSDILKGSGQHNFGNIS